MDTPREKFAKFMQDGRTPRCQADVTRYIGRWPNFGQCCRAATKGSDFCKQHHPEAVEARRREATERERERWNVRRVELWGGRFKAALEKIAEGHNDPRSLAEEVLSMFRGSGL